MQTQSIMVIGSDERRAQIRQFCQRTDLVLIGEIAHSAGLPLIARACPDIVILDSLTPTINILTILPWLCSLPEAPRVIALGSHGSASERRLLLELGAITYAMLDAPGALAEALTLTSKLAHLAGQHPFRTTRPALGSSW